MHTKEMKQTKMVAIKKLKAFVYNKFPVDSPLRNLILDETDLLDPYEFLYASSVWLKLLDKDRAVTRRT